jgi:hypothetical protein
VTNVYELDLEQLGLRLREWGQPGYRARQVYAGLWRRTVSYEEMTDLPKALRMRLAEELPEQLETMANYRPTRDAIARLLDPDGMSLGARHVTVSTVGVPEIRRLGMDHPQVGLAVSLHAADDRQARLLCPHRPPAARPREPHPDESHLGERVPAEHAGADPRVRSHASRKRRAGDAERHARPRDRSCLRPTPLGSRGRVLLGLGVVGGVIAAVAWLLSVMPAERRVVRGQVPNVVGLQARDAVKTLAEAGLIAEIRIDSSAPHTGEVLRSEPAADVELAPGSSVLLTVAWEPPRPPPPPGVDPEERRGTRRSSWATTSTRVASSSWCSIPASISRLGVGAWPPIWAKGMWSTERKAAPPVAGGPASDPR